MSVVALDIDVLLRLIWLDVFNADILFSRPDHEGSADMFRAIFDANCFGDIVKAYALTAPKIRGVTRLVEKS